MARLSNAEKDKREKEAKRLFINGTDTATIASLTGVGRDTVARWAAAGKWDDSRDALSVSIDEINLLIMESITMIKEGKMPKVSPDKIAKLVAAYEKLNDKQKSLRYGMPALNTLTDEIIKDISSIKSKKKQQEYIEFLKRVRCVMDDMIDKWFTQINS